MRPHLTEEELVLRHYAEADLPAEHERHFAACGPCRSALEALRHDLATVEVPEPPLRGDDYGARVWARLQGRLAAEARRAPVPRPRRAAALRRVGVPLGLAASLVVAFLAGRHWPPAPAPAAVPEAARERILLVAVGDHLERSQMLLVELVNAGGGEGPVDISTQQEWAEELVGANRLYRQTVAREGDPALSGLLDELERLLVEVTHHPSSLAPGELEDIRRRIDSRSLLFRVRVIETQVRNKGKAGAGAPAGAEVAS
ncbi:MAG TPA: hypothetical protein VMR21_07395 [Vicinamibacteria bacterium]|nr:hypothetical protein [Vicinamibacteria bacterium]